MKGADDEGTSLDGRRGLTTAGAYVAIAGGIVLAVLALSRLGGSEPTENPPVRAPLVQRKEVLVGGLTRTYRLYSPASLDRSRPAPLLLVLGGVGNDGEDMVSPTDFDTIAGEEGFLVAYPDGVRKTWNAGYCCLGRTRSGPDDVAFLTSLIDQVGTEEEVDPARVFVTGVSAGAMMAYRLGCDMADRIAGVGSVAGAMVLEACHPSRPVSVIEFHGTDDGLVPYEGGRTAGGATEPSPSSRAVAQHWAELNGCEAGPREQVDGPVTTSSWSRCASGSAVELVLIQGGGHTWFAPGLGAANGAVDASRAMWSFFEGLPADPGRAVSRETGPR